MIADNHISSLQDSARDVVHVRVDINADADAIAKTTPNTNTSTWSNNDDTNNDLGSGMSFLRVLKFATFFSLGIILVQYFSPSHRPFEWFGPSVGVLSPSHSSLLAHQVGSYLNNDDDVGYDHHEWIGCPPDPYLDHHHNSGGNQDSIFSSDHDPRDKIVSGSLFPHCELSRWVQPPRPRTTTTTSTQCPPGEEFVTTIRSSKRLFSKNKHGRHSHNHTSTTSHHEYYEGIPKLIHVASPTNCLPTTTVQSLRQLIEENNHSEGDGGIGDGAGGINGGDSSSSFHEYAIYIHSHYAMDKILFQREWHVFPEVKEGALCTGEKSRRYAMFALEKLGIVGKDNATTTDILRTATNTNNESGSFDKESIADQLAIQFIRDIWKYLILWEYGGVVVDVDVLNSLVADHNSNNKMKTLLGRLSKNDQDAILFWVNNVKNADPANDRQRVPFTKLMAFTPQHPLIFFTLKWAIFSGISNFPLPRGPKNVKMKRWEIPRNDMFHAQGRQTDVPSLHDGLIDFLPQYEKLPIDANARHEGEDRRSIFFLNGDEFFLTPQFSSPYVSWEAMYSFFPNGGDSRDIIKDALLNAQKYASKQGKELFDCMEYQLMMYSSSLQ